MMRHPFDGLQQLASGAEAAPVGETRRSVLGKMVFATAGLLGLKAAASAQVATTNALGEEGGGQILTTLALGEEGGVTAALREQGGAKAMPTTEPFGEEAGKVTSFAVPGLEDGGKPMASTEAKGEEGGGPLTRALNEGGVTTRALGEEGGPVTGALNEGGIRMPVVTVPPLAKDLNDKQMDAQWADMAANEQVKGVQGCAIVYGAKKAVPFLKEHLNYKVPEVDEKRVAKLIADLDNDAFQVREKAEKDLEATGAAALPALQKALKDTSSTEVRMRVKRLIDKSKDQSALTQATRGLEVLVALRTPEARELVETLTKGAEKEWMTQAAKKALERIPKDK